MKLNTSTGRVRLYPEMREVLLSGQQAEVLAVLIERAGEPCRRDEIAAAVPKGSCPPTMAQVGVIIANIRDKLGTHRVLTGAGGWWLDASDASRPPAWPGAISFGGIHLDLPRRQLWVSGRRSMIRLGWQEYLVLRALIEAQGMPRGRDEIWLSMPATARPARPSQVGVIVYRLRQRLGRESILTDGGGGGGGWRLAGRTEDAVLSAAASNVLLLDPATRRVGLPSRATSVPLSPQEAATLQVLIEARGVALSARDVFANTPTTVRPKSPSAVSTVVSRLRRKLGPDHIWTGRRGWWLGTPARVVGPIC
ncbi:winged helix-turn-helix domain-containing protein [Micromonospora sp. NBC_01655]|uniref:winged helix-turn-helix domain-containing protein n=1 Tax=Micromonospora sp. NBC_01655 TaxID=2975983 RepID=UPI002255FDAC|nr:winged helix-turn-helix domain-containing protein [Micromonospora sp. NBC_01655]MCX4472953.1 winged helix-turn-helix domain-containing protein [Micromonospora sp. NBC_01655]